MLFRIYIYGCAKIQNFVEMFPNSCIIRTFAVLKTYGKRTFPVWHILY